MPQVFRRDDGQNVLSRIAGMAHTAEGGWLSATAYEPTATGPPTTNYQLPTTNYQLPTTHQTAARPPVPLQRRPRGDGARHGSSGLTCRQPAQVLGSSNAHEIPGPRVGCGLVMATTPGARLINRTPGRYLSQEAHEPDAEIRMGG